MKKFFEFEELFNKLLMFINFKLSVDIRDKMVLKYSDILEKKLIYLVESFIKIIRYIS